MKLSLIWQALKKKLSVLWNFPCFRNIYTWLVVFKDISNDTIANELFNQEQNNELVKRSRIDDIPDGELGSTYNKKIFSKEWR